MDTSFKSPKKKKKLRSLYFIVVAAVTAVAFVYLVKEGKRIKIQHELLSYEVFW